MYQLLFKRCSISQWPGPVSGTWDWTTGSFHLEFGSINSIRFKEERKWFDSGLGLDWAGSGSKNGTMGGP